MKIDILMLRPDSKGRISLGELSKDVTSYKIEKMENGQLLLTPYTEIPFSEKWVFENPDLLDEFKKYINQKTKT